MRYLLIATILYNNFIQAQKPEPVITIGHQKEVTCMQFSPNSKLLATGSLDYSVKVWETQTGKMIYTFDAHNNEITDLHFSPSSRYLASVAQDNQLNIWNIFTGKIQKSIDITDFSGNTEWFHVDLVVFMDENTIRILYGPMEDEYLIREFNWQTLKTKYQISYNPKKEKYFQEQQKKIEELKNTSINYSQITKNDSVFLINQESAERYYFGPSSPDADDTSVSTLDCIRSNNHQFITDGYMIADLVNPGLTHDLSGNTLEYSFAKLADDSTIIATTTDGTIQIIDLKTGKVKNYWDNEGEIYCAEVDAKNGFLLTAGSWKSGLKLWNYKDGTLVDSFGMGNSANHIKAGKRYVIATYIYARGGEYNSIIDMKNHSIIKSNIPGGFPTSVLSSPDETFFYANDTIFKYNDTSYTFFSSIQNSNGEKWGYGSVCDFSLNSKLLAVGSFFADSVILFDLVHKTKKIIRFHDEYLDFSAIKFNPSSKKLILGGGNGSIYIIDVATGNKLKSFVAHNSYIISLNFGSNDNILISEGSDHKMIFWDIQKEQALKLNEVYGQTDRSTYSHDDYEFFDFIKSSVFPGPDKNKILSLSWDKKINSWDISKQKQLYSIVGINFDDVGFISPSNYYFGSKTFARSLSFRVDGKLYGFDQFDMALNRPDLVLKTTGSLDTSLISYYNRIWKMRIKRAGLSPEIFTQNITAPEIRILKPDFVTSATDSGLVKLVFTATDKKYRIKSYSIYINEVIVNGRNGFATNTSIKTNLKDSVIVSLSYGLNKIQVSCLNETGVESRRETIYLTYTPSRPKKDTLYFIGIGVNQYKNHPCRNLSFAAKDINDLDTLFKKNTVPKGYLFLDSNATREKIMKIIDTLMQSNINDKVIIALSGHGLLNKQRGFYFGTYDINFNNPEERGLSYDSLVSLLDDIPARKKLLLIDACHSGEVDTSGITNSLAEEYKKLPATDCKDTTQGKKNDPENDIKSSSVGLDNSFELMKELFTDLSRGNGAVVISAARGSGYAEEDPAWQNGAFTLCLKAAFSGNKLFPELLKSADINGDGVSINELKEYILTNVPKITNERQKPTTRRENIEVDWKLLY